MSRTRDLEKALKQKFKNSNGATLIISQRDSVRGYLPFFALNIKTVTVKCNATGKVIPKWHWNAKTRTEASKLSSKYKVSKTGWYIFIVLLIITLVLTVLFYT